MRHEFCLLPCGNAQRYFKISYTVSHKESTRDFAAPNAPACQVDAFALKIYATVCRVK